MERNKVSDIRNEFAELFLSDSMCENGTYEIVNASFVADSATIFGINNSSYLQCELEWYLSQDRNVMSMPCKTPKIWEQVSDKDGNINSNYGWCIFSEENENQYQSVIECLYKDLYSRQAIMIYTRPSMHEDSKSNGMSDFICTNTVQILVRDNKVDYIVSMRSNDAVFGYKNDKHWHDFVHDKVVKDLSEVHENVKKGTMYWNASSLHVYPRHFKLIEDFIDETFVGLQHELSNN